MHTSNTTHDDHTRTHTQEKGHGHGHEHGHGQQPQGHESWTRQNMPKARRLEKKYGSRVYLGNICDSHGRVFRSMQAGMQKHIDDTQHALHKSRKIRRRDKKDRATTELVMDQRTKTVLYSMIGSGLLDAICGCISTGKEANVYYAYDVDGTQFALKIYKTSILKFKDRRKYVKGIYIYGIYACATYTLHIGITLMLLTVRHANMHGTCVNIFGCGVQIFLVYLCV